MRRLAKLILLSIFVNSLCACSESPDKAPQPTVPPQDLFPCYDVQPNFKGVGDKEDLSVEEVMALGQLGGTLCPTPDEERPPPPPTSPEIKKQNRLFADAMELWNVHSYDESVIKLKEYLELYPKGIWSGEAKLHLGCEARFNGRYNEANKIFSELVLNYSDKKLSGNIKLAEKAKSRLAILRLLENNPEDSTALFADLASDTSNWRLRTYAQNWMSQISRKLGNNHSLADCGYRALELVLAKKGIDTQLHQRPSSREGQSLAEIIKIAADYGVTLQAVKIGRQQLSEIPLPAIVQIDRTRTNGAGHYWILEKKTGENLEVFDAQAGRRFFQTVDEFAGEWGGYALVFDLPKSLEMYRLDAQKTKNIFGGCCGVQRVEDDLGDPDNDDPAETNECEQGGCPRWKVNPANQNIYAYDIPIWYQPATGPTFRFKLSYNSQSALAQNETFGNKWFSNFSTYVLQDPGSTAAVFMPDGRRLLYAPIMEDGSTFTIKAFELGYGTGAVLEPYGEKGYRLKLPNGTTYYYTLPAGKVASYIGLPRPPSRGAVRMIRPPSLIISQQVFLTKIEDVHGKAMTLEYDEDIHLRKITDADGLETVLEYNSDQLVTKITDPFGRTALFEYDDKRNLVAITDMGGYKSEFTYDDTVYFTSIKKPQGTWKFFVEPSDSAEINGINYPPPGGAMGRSYRVTITNPNGGKAEHSYIQYSKTGGGYQFSIEPRNYIEYESEKVNNYYNKNKSIVRFATRTAPARVAQRTYAGNTSYYSYFDKNGFLQSTRDGVYYTDTKYEHNAYGQLMKISRLDRYKTFEYLNNHSRLPTKIVQLGADGQELISTFTYNTDNFPTSYTLTNGKESRVWSMKYNSDNQLIELDGPRTDVSDISTFTYYDCSEPNSCGRLASSTNPIGETTLYKNYKPGGLVGTIVRPHGVTTDYTYDGLNRIATVSTHDATNDYGTTTYEYSAPQQGPTKITSTDGRELDLTYDEEGRLLRATNSKGYHLDLVRDIEGLVTAREFYDPNDQLLTKFTYEYTKSGYLHKVFNADEELKVTYGRTLAGLISWTHYPKNTNSYYEQQIMGSTSYNKFGEPKMDLGYPKSRADYTYTTSGHLAQIKNTYSRITNYKYNTFGELIEEDNPIRGITRYNYDSAGNLVSKTDARGITKKYTYDELNRRISTLYPTPSENISFTYTSGTNRTVDVSDEDGSSLYTYDHLGRLTSHERTQNGETHKTSYSYTDNNKEKEITYPSGRKVHYEYGNDANILKITSTADGGSEEVVVDHVSFRGDNKLLHLEYGNGRQLDLSYDNEGRLKTLINPDDAFAYTYGSVDNLREIVNGAQVQTFSYDRLGQLEFSKGSFGRRRYSSSYMFDRTGEEVNFTRRQLRYEKSLQLLDLTEIVSIDKNAHVEPVRSITWTDSLSAAPDDVGKSQILECPPGGTLHGVWGTDLYSDTSSICSAAVHAGIIDTNDGGTLRLLVENELTEFFGLDRNGVQSADLNEAGHLSFRLTSWRQGPPDSYHIVTTFTYDDVGNTVSKGDLTYTYNDRGRMQTAIKPGMTAAYKYEATGRRSSKVVNGIRTDYFYDRHGRLLAWKEGTIWHENIYMGATIIAVVQNGNLYYVDPDYQGKALRLTDGQGNTVWTGEWEPFRESDRVRNGVNYNQRAMGQILDEETGNYYNIYREYDPLIGRYTQPDPVGLAAGWNNYAYVKGNPVKYQDPNGLAHCTYTTGGTVLTCVSTDRLVTISIGPGDIFSGFGPYINDPDSGHLRNLGVIPEGEYIMHWRADKFDGSYELVNSKYPNYDPIKDGSSCLVREDESERCGFYLHLGTKSMGCITVYAEKYREYTFFPFSYRNIYKFPSETIEKKWKRLMIVLKNDRVHGYGNTLTVTKW